MNINLHKRQIKLFVHLLLWYFCSSTTDATDGCQINSILTTNATSAVSSLPSASSTCVDIWWGSSTSSSQWIQFALLNSYVKHTHWQTDFLYRNEGTTNCHRTVKEIRCLFLLLNGHHSSTFNSGTWQFNSRWTVPRRKWTSRGAQNIQIASSYLSGSTLKWFDYSLWRFFNGNVLLNWYYQILTSHILL